MEYEKKAPIKRPTKHKGYSKKYPQFAFRVPQTDAAEKTLKRLKAAIDALHKHHKSRCPEGHKLPNRNDIILEALEKGVLVLKKEAGI